MTKAKTESVADLVERARAHRLASDEVPPASIIGAVAGRKYSVIVTRDYTDKQLPAIRRYQEQRGYTLCDGGEFMIGEPNAEIWWTPQEVGDDEWKDEFIANLLNPAWLNLQGRRTNHGIAKRVMELATKYHDFAKLKPTEVNPESVQAAKDAVIRHVRATSIPDLQARY